MDTLGNKFAVNSWAAIVLMTWQRGDAFDLRNDHLLLLLGRRFLSCEPFVKRRARHLEHAAKNFDCHCFYVLSQTQASAVFFYKEGRRFF